MRRMGYVDDNLIQGESVQYRAPLHWKVMIGPGLLSGAFIALSMLAFRQAWTTIDNANTFKIAGAVLLVFAVIPIIKARITVSSSEFAVTNKRVILKTGFIRNQTAEMFLAKVESVGVEQTVMGRIVGYGSIVIRGTGGSLEPFSGIARPLEFRRQIQEQIGRSLDRPIERSLSDRS